MRTRSQGCGHGERNCLLELGYSTSCVSKGRLQKSGGRSLSLVRRPPRWVGARAFISISICVIRLDYGYLRTKPAPDADADADADAMLCVREGRRKEDGGLASRPAALPYSSSWLDLV